MFSPLEKSYALRDKFLYLSRQVKFPPNNRWNPTTSRQRLLAIDGGNGRCHRKIVQGGYMNYKFRTLAVALFLAATTMLPLVKADEWNKETTVTFSDPVAVPGQVLPPGRYVFKLADKQSDRHIV